MDSFDEANNRDDDDEEEYQVPDLVFRPEEEDLVRGNYDEDDERSDLGFTDEEDSDDVFNDRSDHEVDLTDADVFIPEPVKYRDDLDDII